MPAPVTIAVDRSVCIGAGQCALTAPDVFTQDDDGYGTVRPGRETAGGTMLREAVRVCPVRAITVHDARDPGA
ncbi:ferredoxin [Streptomyces tritici]|uniref:ferredoxin n=1 Tax=Streptomyces tritici TaxID=2054410 RepID=UPI003AEFBC19